MERREIHTEFLLINIQKKSIKFILKDGIKIYYKSIGFDDVDFVAGCYAQGNE